MQLGDNLKVAATLTACNAASRLAIIQRRLDLMTNLGENKRSTVCWRDAIAEMAELNREFTMTTWPLRSKVEA